jgi:phage baseplate assembly protein W
MAEGLSPALPLILDEKDGPYRLNKEIPELVRQNLKMVLFTIPGEKVMDPKFGVGLSKYIFENFGADLNDEIITDIKEQVDRYLPYIYLNNIILQPADIDENILNITISYQIPGNFDEQQLTFILGGN